MKTAVGLVLMAALGNALPQLAWTNTTLGYSNTDANNESKLPWIEYNADKVRRHECQKAMAMSASRRSIEEACGTYLFCRRFSEDVYPEDYSEFSAQYGYKSQAECLAAHEPEHITLQKAPEGSTPTITQKAPKDQSSSTTKLPWIGFNNTRDEFDKCVEVAKIATTREEVEEACGTFWFCHMFNDGYWPDLPEFSAQYGYTSLNECLAAHDPKPSPTPDATESQSTPAAKHPWVDFNNEVDNCMEIAMARPARDEVEKACGTLRFCHLFYSGMRSDYQEPPEQYGYTSYDECLAAHDPKPSTIQEAELLTNDYLQPAAAQESSSASAETAEDWGPTTIEDASQDQITPEAKLPWLEFKQNLISVRECCDVITSGSLPLPEANEACGTEMFCNLFDPAHSFDWMEFSDLYGYASKTECLAAHEPRP